MEKKTQAEEILYVYPQDILRTENMGNLKEMRNDDSQERLRMFIASNTNFIKLEESVDFCVFKPKRTWYKKTVEQLVDMAQKSGRGIVNMKKLSLIFLQILSNEGFSERIWERLANVIDTSDSYLLVECGREEDVIKYCLVGDSSENKPKCPPSYISEFELYPWEETFFTTPLVFGELEKSKRDTEQQLKRQLEIRKIMQNLYI